MRTKKLYITPSIEEVSIEVSNILTRSGWIYPWEEEEGKDDFLELDVDLDREGEGFAE